MDVEQYKKTTGGIYGNLFTAYSDKQFEESVNLFFIRHKQWKIDLDWFKDKVCLDAGSGGGRFVVALAQLGAKKAHGIDISTRAIQAGKMRAHKYNLTNTEFTQASVLDIPFANQKFDYVVCSGVIHHTPDPFKGFQEVTRVLKPKGKIFLSVYGKGGLRWMTNDLFRYTVCKIIPFSGMEIIFKFFGVSANKRYNTLDNLYVPYCYRFKEKTIRKWLQDAGFENIQRVKFERYDYKTLLSRIIHGEGWIQIYADKK
ncbi:MAG TPA: class I SAM-dependent methyltransferase [Ignavibacteria bacterium]|mgnify:CR=1 FL=1|nr:class I SAM-dependent methyltransferase [Ignavibacteria bacterium]